MTPDQKVEACIAANSAVYSGRNVLGGKAITIAAATLRRLERAGRLTLSISPDGGLIGRWHPNSRTAAGEGRWRNITHCKTA